MITVRRLSPPVDMGHGSTVIVFAEELTSVERQARRLQIALHTYHGDVDQEYCQACKDVLEASE